jgi:hypothetical protein
MFCIQILPLGAIWINKSGLAKVTGKDTQTVVSALIKQAKKLPT